MASYSSSTNCSVDFSEEEKGVLEKASVILKDLGKALWQGNGTDEEDELSFFFSELGNGIENALKGNYWMS